MSGLDDKRRARLAMIALQGDRHQIASFQSQPSASARAASIRRPISWSRRSASATTTAWLRHSATGRAGLDQERRDNLGHRRRDENKPTDHHARERSGLILRDFMSLGSDRPIFCVSFLTSSCMDHMERYRATDQLKQRPPTFTVFARARGKRQVGSQGLSSGSPFLIRDSSRQICHRGAKFRRRSMKTFWIRNLKRTEFGRCGGT